jgi:hypothetical protein
LLRMFRYKLLQVFLEVAIFFPQCDRFHARLL